MVLLDTLESDMNKSELAYAFLNEYGIDNEAALHYAYDLVMILEMEGSI